MTVFRAVVTLLLFVSFVSGQSDPLCCVCSKGSDSGSDLWTFPKAQTPECQICCENQVLQGRTPYHTGRELSSSVCSANRPMTSDSDCGTPPAQQDDPEGQTVVVEKTQTQSSLRRFGGMSATWLDANRAYATVMMTNTTDCKDEDHQGINWARCPCDVGHYLDYATAKTVVKTVTKSCWIREDATGVEFEVVVGGSRPYDNGVYAVDAFWWARERVMTRSDAHWMGMFSLMTSEGKAATYGPETTGAWMLDSDYGPSQNTSRVVLNGTLGDLWVQDPCAKSVCLTIDLRGD